MKRPRKKVKTDLAAAIKRTAEKTFIPVKTANGIEYKRPSEIGKGDKIIS